MTIYLFDFDDTITRLPYEDSLTYMMKEESLNPSLEFKPIKRTKKGYDEAVQKNDGPIFLLSNRVAPLKNSLEKVLNEMSGKEYSFLKTKLADLLVSEITPVGDEIKKLLGDKSHLIQILKVCMVIFLQQHLDVYLYTPNYHRI